jgi:hypothetical protein
VHTPGFFFACPERARACRFLQRILFRKSKEKNTFFPLVVFLCKNIVQWDMSSCYENNWSVVADSGSADSVTDILRWTHA